MEVLFALWIASILGLVYYVKSRVALSTSEKMKATLRPYSGPINRTLGVSNKWV